MGLWSFMMYVCILHVITTNHALADIAASTSTVAVHEMTAAAADDKDVSPPHFIFYKTHKTGSSTIANMFSNYVVRHNMTVVQVPFEMVGFYDRAWEVFLLANGGTCVATSEESIYVYMNHTGPAIPDGMRPEKSIDKYCEHGVALNSAAKAAIWMNHGYWSPFMRFMVPDGHEVTILRDPATRYISAIYFFGVKQLSDWDCKVEKFLRKKNNTGAGLTDTDADRGDAQPPGQWHADRMCYDLGIEGVKDENGMKRVLGYDILIVEQLDRTLLNFRRKYKLAYADILTFDQKIQVKKRCERYEVDEKTLQYIYDINPCDVELYHRAMKQLDTLPDVQMNEAELLQEARDDYIKQCGNYTKQDMTDRYCWSTQHDVMPWHKHMQACYAASPVREQKFLHDLEKQDWEPECPFGGNDSKSSTSSSSRLVDMNDTETEAVLEGDEEEHEEAVSDDADDAAEEDDDDETVVEDNNDVADSDEISEEKNSQEDEGQVDTVGAKDNNSREMHNNTHEKNERQHFDANHDTAVAYTYTVSVDGNSEMHDNDMQATASNDSVPIHHWHQSRLKIFALVSVMAIIAIIFGRKAVTSTRDHSITSLHQVIETDDDLAKERLLTSSTL